MGLCGNPLCSESDRGIERVAAIAAKTGAIDDKIKKLKYSGRTGWAMIFGRILLGWLEQNHSPSDYDLIVANPTYVDATAEAEGRVRHTELVIESAAREDVLGLWPFDTAEPCAIIKTGPTPRSATGNYVHKLAAADALSRVLAVPTVGRTAGKRILLYDDIATTCRQLDRVALFLRRSGRARSVEAVVLARTRYRGPA